MSFKIIEPFHQWDLSVSNITLLDDNKSEKCQNVNDINQEMTDIKNDLDSAKDKYEIIYNNGGNKRDWILSLLNPLNRTLKQELTSKYSVKHPNNGYIKMWEILHHYKQHFDSDKEYKVFCNAEFPGGFLLACIDYFTKYAKGIQWIASSLYDLEIDNKLIDQYNLLKDFPNNWLISHELSESKKYRGNVSDINDVKYMIDKCIEKLGKVDVYTADGGIGVEGNYNNQDYENAHVNLGQITVGLATLNEGGFMTTKQYNFTAPYTYTIDLIFGSLFTRSYIIKPASSRPGNSETYLVGIGYLGYDDKIMNYLFNIIEKKEFHKSLLCLTDKNLPDLENLVKIQRELIKIQIEYLGRNGNTINRYKNNPNKLKQDISRIEKSSAYKWIDENMK